MKIFAILLALSSGCFVLPKTTTTTKDLGTETGDVEHGAVQKLDVQAALDDTVIDIAATAERACSRPVYQVTEIRKEKHASYRANKDARAGLFALVLAPVTIPLSAIGTGIAVLADGDGVTSRTQKTVGSEKFACTTVAPSLALNVTLPSGAVIVETTNEEGLARVRIPETEPYAGVVTIDAPGAHRELRYARAMPAVTAVREMVMKCGTVHHVTGTLKLELAIDGDGHAETIELDAGDGLFSQCVSEGLAKTRFSAAHRAVRLVLPFELPG